MADSPNCPLLRVLLAHNYYRSSSPSGENASFEDEAELLEERGHKVIRFTRHNDAIARFSKSAQARALAGTIWSRDARRELRALIARHTPDVAHFHNTFPLISPAAYSACREAGLPIVQTLHNYRLLCPNAVCYRDGHVCHDCAGRRFAWPAVAHACYRDSRAASAATAAMLATHGALRTWRRMVDVYVTPSEFTRQRFIAHGFPPEQLVVKPHFLSPDPGSGAHDGGFALFAGRLSSEKGVATLLDAWDRLRQPLPLRIVGDGPLAGLVEAGARRNPSIGWLGNRPHADVMNLMGAATLLVVPSETYETFGRVVIEAFARGTPVLAANIGALPELVAGRDAGALFAPGDADDLARQVDALAADSARLANLGAGARAAFVATYTAERNYQRLLDVYALARSRIPGRRGTQHANVC